MKPDSYTTKQLNAIFAALADPTRRAILARLAKGEATVSQLADPFEISQPAVSKHLKVLEKSGLIERGQDRQSRPAYLKAAPMKDAQDWISQFQKFWGTNFDQLDSLLGSMEDPYKERQMMTDLPTYTYNREFNAPLAKVWKTWTDPKLLAIWYGPGVETVIHEFDLRPGGRWLNEMKWGEKSDFSRMDFVEVVLEEKLVWNHFSTDSEWNVQANQMMPNWPKNLLTTVRFSSHGAGVKLRLEQTPIDATEAEIACFTEMMGGMDSGWGKGFDLFETLLDTQTDAH